VSVLKSLLQYLHVARVFQIYTHTVTSAYLLEIIVILMYVATGEILARFFMDIVLLACRERGLVDPSH